MSVEASVIVRTKNKADTLEAAVASLRAQTVPVEIVVVDSGSSDATVDMARSLADEVVEMEAGTFSFGRALNFGARTASGSVLFALSAHCRADDPRWVARSLSHYQDPSLAGTCGLRFDVDGRPLAQARIIDPAEILAEPGRGFSNHASSWRRETWEEMPFNDGLSTCEDKEWMWRAMLNGWRFVADPELVVDSPHRRTEGALTLWRRVYGERRMMSSLLQYDGASFGDFVGSWWSNFPYESRYPRWARRMSFYRSVEYLAGYLGERRGMAERDSETIRLDSIVPRIAP